MAARTRNPPSLDDAVWARFARDARDAVVFSDGDRIVDVNDSFLRMLGLTRAQVIGRRTLPFFTPEHAEDARRRIDGHVAGIYASEIRRGDGSRLPVEIDVKEIDVAGRHFRVALVRDHSAWRALEGQSQDSSERLQRSLTETVKALAHTIEKRDPYTAGHQNRVARISVLLAEELGLPSFDAQGIEMAAMIHDIGKIAIPSEILAKPGRLSGQELELVRSHCLQGHEILKDIDLPWPVAECVLLHHERIDGSGYPTGSDGDNLRDEIRIIAVADVLDAIASHRPYRPALGLTAGLEEIASGRGTLYDAAVTDAVFALDRRGALGDILH